MRLNVGRRVTPSERSGFICVLNPSGSGLRWSTLLSGVQVNALVPEHAGGVYVTGRIKGSGTHGAFDDLLVPGISEGGRRVSYLGPMKASGYQEGRAISIGAGGRLLVTGETDSRESAKGGVAMLHREPQRAFVLALQPCSATRA